MSGRRVARIVAVCVLVQLVPTAVTSSQPESRAANAVFQRYSLAGPGCAAGVFSSGAIAYEGYFGLANVENAVPIDATTAFNIGSISKEFTAMAVLLLVSEHRLRLEESIAGFFPMFPSYARQITVYDLLHQTSGVRDYIELLMMQGIGPYSELVTNREALSLLYRQSRLNFKPGTQYQYSNSNYLLLGRVVEKVSGVTLEHFLSHAIFEPLGMTHTTLVDQSGTIIRNRAYSYLSDGTLRTVADQASTTGDGGIFTTVEDMARWDANFSALRVGNAWIIEQMQRPGRLVDGSTVAYGSGLEVSTYHGMTSYEHGGADAGYHAYYLRLNQPTLSTIVLCNVRGDSEPSPYSLASQLADAFLPPALTRAAAIPKARPIEKRQLRDVPGVFLDPSGGTVLHFRASGATLSVTDDAGPKAAYTSLLSEGPTALISADGSLCYRFDEHFRTAADCDATERVLYRRTTEPVVGSQSEYAGDYCAADLDTVWRVRVHDDHLTLAFAHEPPQVLEPVSRDGFYSDRWTLIFKRNAQGRVARLSVHNARLYGLGFVKCESRLLESNQTEFGSYGSSMVAPTGIESESTANGEKRQSPEKPAK